LSPSVNSEHAAKDGAARVVKAILYIEISCPSELTNLALQGCDLRFVVGHKSRLDLLVAELAAVELRQPHLDEVG
jgi:hypothetical protein